jgi:hypothetical protein
MAVDPISAGYLAASSLGAYSSWQGGREAEQAYEASAREVETQTAYQQRMALEEMKEMDREAREAEGHVRATAGGKGLRVGGSVATVQSNIRRKVAKRKAMMAFEFNEQARRSRFEAGRLRYAGSQARQAGEIGAFGSLLTGGIALAERAEKFDWNTKQLFLPGTRKKKDRRMTHPQYYYGPGQKAP